MKKSMRMRYLAAALLCAALLLAGSAAAECLHENYVIVNELEARGGWIDDGNDTTHSCTVEYYYRCTCEDCSTSFTADAPHKTEVLTQEHSPKVPFVCEYCGYGCDHETFNEYNVCLSCGLECPHAKYTQGICDVCLYACSHSFKGDVCSICKWVCPHESQTMGLCDVCAAELCGHENLTDGTCGDCGFICGHVTFDEGTCVLCGYTCPHGDYTASGVCRKCDYQCRHRFADGGFGGTCLNCGQECVLMTLNGGSCAHGGTGRYSTTSIAGTDNGDGLTHTAQKVFQSWRYCTICCVWMKSEWNSGDPWTENHAMETGVCSVCKYECSHSFVRGVCKLCAYECPHEDKTGFANDRRTEYQDDGNGETHTEYNAYYKPYYCYDCGIKYYYVYQYSIKVDTYPHEYDADGKCGDCDYQCPHDEYSRSVCLQCGGECPHGVFADGKCAACGYVCGHVFAEGRCEACSELEMKITAQPKDAKAAEGSSARTSVAATGEGLTYQWYYRNPGQESFTKGTCTSAGYAATMKPARDGRQVYCEVTDCYGNALRSLDATLTMAEPIVIAAQPQNVKAAFGTSAKTSVAASGDGDLSYQWYYKDPGSESFAKGTCTKANYSVKMTEARDGRQIYCVITDAYGGKKQTDTVTLDGYTALKITTQPKGQNTAFNGNAKTSVAAQGEGLTYQWYYKDPGASGFTKGTCTKADYSVKMTAARDGRKVYCVVTDKYGNSAKSSTVTLDGYTALKITTQPSGQTAAIGSYAKTSVAAAGEGLTYQWYYKDPGKSSFSKGTCTIADYSVKMTAARDGRQIYCQIKDAYGNSVKTNTVTLDGYTALKITTQPKGQRAAFGTNARTSVAAVGEGKLTYQWYYKDVGGEWTKAQSTTANYVATMTKARDGRQIYCEIKDSRTSIKSSTVTLDGYTELKITKQPAGQTVAIGSYAKTSIAAQGDGLTYQWYYKNPNMSSYAKGECVSANYSMKMTEARDGRQIYCKVTDAYGNTVKSNTVTLTAE